MESKNHMSCLSRKKSWIWNEVMGHDELVLFNVQELVMLKRKLLDRICTGKKACVLQRRDGCRDGLQNSCLCAGSHGVVAAG